jgi:hypothetical protein
MVPEEYRNFHDIYIIHEQRCRQFVLNAISPKIVTLPAICYQDDSSVYLDN